MICCNITTTSDTDPTTLKPCIAKNATIDCQKEQTNGINNDTFFIIPPGIELKERNYHGGSPSPSTSTSNSIKIGQNDSNLIEEKSFPGDEENHESSYNNDFNESVNDDNWILIILIFIVIFLLMLLLYDLFFCNGFLRLKRSWRRSSTKSDTNSDTNRERSTVGQIIRPIDAPIVKPPSLSGSLSDRLSGANSTIGLELVEIHNQGANEHPIGVKPRLTSTGTSVNIKSAKSTEYVSSTTVKSFGELIQQATRGSPAKFSPNLTTKLIRATQAAKLTPQKATTRIIKSEKSAKSIIKRRIKAARSSVSLSSDLSSSVVIKSSRTFDSLSMANKTEKIQNEESNQSKRADKRATMKSDSSSGSTISASDIIIHNSGSKSLKCESSGNGVQNSPKAVATYKSNRSLVNADSMSYVVAKNNKQ